VSSPDKADILLLVDVHNLSWISYYAPVKNEKLDKQGYPAYHYEIALGRIASVIEYINRDVRHKVCIITSADEYPSKKKKLFPEYKAQRERELKEYNVKTIDGETMSKALDPVRDIKHCLSMVPHCKVSIPTKDEETDDILATLTKMFKDKECYILSSDRDLWQLNYKNVHIVYQGYPQIKVVGKADVKKKFLNKDYRLIPFIKTLTGDASDNLKGVYRFPRKVIPQITYANYKGNPKKALKYISGLVTKTVKEKIESDKDRLVKLHSIIKLNRNLDLTLSKKKGNLKKFCKFLKDRNLLDSQFLTLWD
jgi:5'-3' exonuclease